MRRPTPDRIPATARMLQILDGDMGLPSHMYIGNDCIHGHGKDGKTVRYKKTGSCIMCNAKHNSARAIKQFTPRNTNALAAYEARQHQDDDYDPLFDEEDLS